VLPQVLSRQKPVPSKAPACPTPAPTPAGNQGYVLVASGQRCAEAIPVGNVGAGRRRLEADGDAVASACWSLCASIGYIPQFYFNTQASSGDCYCCYTW
jgi:hypothetical protein